MPEGEVTEFTSFMFETYFREVVILFRRSRMKMEACKMNLTSFYLVVDLVGNFIRADDINFRELMLIEGRNLITLRYKIFTLLNTSRYRN
jgi:hypothetical protein